MADMTATINLTARDSASNVIADVEVHLRRLNDLTDQFGSHIGQLNTDDVTASMRRFGSAANDTHGILGRLGDMIGGGIGFAAGIAGFNALSGSLQGAVKGAADLEQSVANISTIKPDIDTSQVFGKLNEISTKVPQTADQLGAGLYNIFSSIQVSTEDGLKLVETFAKGAVGAATDAQTFGTAAMGVMNAYGLAVKDADHISDVFFNTVRDGVVTGSELAQGIGLVTQSAKQAGASVEEMGALIVGVTQEAGPASQNINNLNNLLLKIDTKEAQAAFKDLGIASIDATGHLRSPLEVLTDLREKTANLTDAAKTLVMQQIFPDLQARAGAAVVMNELDKVNAALEANKTQTGSAEAAYTKMSATAEAQFKLLRNSFTAITNTLAEQVFPAITPVIHALAEALPGAATAAGNALGSFSNDLRTEAGGALQVVADALDGTGKAWAPWAAQAGDAGVVVDRTLTGTSAVVQALQFALQGNFKAAWKDAQVAMGDFGVAAHAIGKIVEDNMALIKSVAVVVGTWAVFSTVAPAIFAAAAGVEALAGSIALISAAGSAGGVTAALGAIVAIAGGPVTLAIVGVAAAVAALGVAWVNNWGDIQVTTQDVVDNLKHWFTDLDAAMVQNGVIDDLQAAWKNLQDAGVILWGLVRDSFTPAQKDMNAALSGGPGSADTSANNAAAGIKGMAQDLVALTQGVKDTAKDIQTLADAFKAANMKSAELALVIHNDVIGAFRDALDPLQQILDMLHEFSILAEKKYSIHVDIPGVEGLQALLNNIHTVASSVPANNTGGPGGIPNQSAVNSGGATDGINAPFNASVTSVPNAGDVAGWAAWLKNSGAIPTDLIDDPVFLKILLTGAKAESGLDASKIQGGFSLGSGSGARGLFQYDMGGMGAPWKGNESALLGPEGALLQARGIIPEYANAYRSRAAQGMSGAAQAAYVADQAEKPEGAWPGGAGDNNYRAAYYDLFAGGGNAGVGSFTSAGGAVNNRQHPTIGPSSTEDVAASEAILAADNAKKLGEALASPTQQMTKLLQDNSKWLDQSQAKETRARGQVDTDTTTKLDSMASQRDVQADIKQRKDALSDQIADETRLNNEKVAAQELVTNRGLQDAQIRSSRESEDTQIATQQRLAAEATTHSRALEDTEIQYQHGLQLQATTHARQLEDAKIVADQILQQQAVVHSRQLQDEQTKVNAQLANAQLVHQRAVQDAQIQPNQQLADTAVGHSRGLQDQDSAYATQKTQERDAAAYAVQLAEATSDAERVQITKNHEQTLRNMQLQAQYAAEDLAHRRQMEDAEMVYQEGLTAAALKRQRSAQDAELQYQAGVADKATAAQRARDDQEADYQRGLAASALDAARDAADREQQYRDGLAQKALEHSRALQDVETQYQIGLAAKALAARRAAEDKALADQRAAEDLAIAHKAELEAAARAFTKEEKAKQDALDKQLADEAYDRQVELVRLDAENKKKAIIENAQLERTAHVDAFKDAAARIVEVATAAAKKAGGDATPIIDSWIGKIQEVIDAYGDADTDSVKHLKSIQSEMQTLVNDTKSVATAAGEANSAIQGIQDKTVTITTRYSTEGTPTSGGSRPGAVGDNSGDSNTGAPVHGSVGMGADTGGGSSSSGSGNASPFPASTIGSSGPGGKYNDPSTGQPYTHAAGGVTTGPVGGIFGEAGPEAIIPLGEYFVSHKSDAIRNGPTRLHPDDIRAIAAALAGVNLIVEVDQVYNGLLRKERQSGKLWTR